MDYFYVYQNKTYYEERSGNFLWSPKYASGGKRNAGYETMKQVRSGDIIFHSYQGEIVAISIAQSSCYTSPRPSSSFSEWANDGWRIDTKYYTLGRGLKIAPFIPDLYEIQPSNGPYNASFRGKQQYLCNANKAIFEFLMDKIIDIQYTVAAKNAIREFIKNNT